MKIFIGKERPLFCGGDNDRLILVLILHALFISFVRLLLKKKHSE